MVLGNKPDTMTERVRVALEIEIQAAIRSARDQGFDIQATWNDEYGGPQSVVGGVHITLVAK